MGTPEPPSAADLPGGAYRRALVVVNPIAGRGLGARAAGELVEGLNRSGVSSELFSTSSQGEAVARLRTLDPEVDLVVAVGGDGTLREVFDGLAEPETCVGVLPFGTANVLANEFGHPRDVHHALEILTRRNVTPIDVSRVNGRLSFLVTGIGFDAMVVREVEERRHGPITKLDYVGAVARTLLRYRPPRLTVELDGEALAGEYGFVLVSNLRGYAGLLHLTEDARIDDGRFEVFLFPTGRLRELTAFFVRGFVRRLPGGAVEMRRARRIRVTSEEPVPYQTDGDSGGSTPVEIDVAPNQYRLVIP